MIDRGSQQTVGIKLPICILEKGEDAFVRFSFMNESDRQALKGFGYKVDGWEAEANQEYPFKQLILELMGESRIYDFRGKQYLLEVRYLAHDQKSQCNAFVYTFEGLAK